MTRARRGTARARGHGGTSGEPRRWTPAVRPGTAAGAAPATAVIAEAAAESPSPSRP
ncbi:hypothetical protein [Kitasatospora cineracea]|uniref:hypothetical protein n=1 Tax=Kitasatospora cineracea TaxID=88074 RepID=UPI0013C2EB22|nr:hypothetical protein [Kitasatospora cineracea]